MNTYTSTFDFVEDPRIYERIDIKNGSGHTISTIWKDVTDFAPKVVFNSEEYESLMFGIK
jgi:hypothetical protein